MMAKTGRIEGTNTTLIRIPDYAFSSEDLVWYKK